MYMEEQSPYNIKNEIYRGRPYNDHMRDQKRRPKTAIEDYHNEITYELTRINSMIGSLLNNIEPEYRKQYLEAEQKYRNVVFNLLDIANEKVGD